MLFAPNVFSQRTEPVDDRVRSPLLEWFEKYVFAADFAAEIIIHQGRKNDDAQVAASFQSFVNVSPEDVANGHAGVDNDENRFGGIENAGVKSWQAIQPLSFGFIMSDHSLDVKD